MQIRLLNIFFGSGIPIRNLKPRTSEIITKKNQSTQEKIFTKSLALLIINYSCTDKQINGKCTDFFFLKKLLLYIHFYIRGKQTKKKHKDNEKKREKTYRYAYY